PIADLKLMAGDVLLVEGAADELSRMHRSGLISLMGSLRTPPRRIARRGLSLAILAAVVLLAAFGVMPILVSVLLGVIAMFVTGCISPGEAYEQVDWSVLILLGSLIPLGVAMQKSGTAQLVASAIVELTRPLGPYGTLGAFYLATSLLTEIISNNAAAVVLVPVAVSTATALGLSPMPFAVAVMLAGSNSFMTPIGYQTNTFVYGPGGYRFTDYTRMGAPLNLLLAGLATLVVPMFFPFAR
ncbi:MAG: SLC13 family permease, partial [Myxococcales bacterium]